MPVFVPEPEPQPQPEPAQPSAPRRASVELPAVDTVPRYAAPPAAAPEPLIYIPVARKARAPIQRAPYNKAARPAHKRTQKLDAPAPIVTPEADVPYIEAVTETLAGEHLLTEVHIFDRPLRDGRLVRRKARGWRRIAVA
ncbi:hypothetical protein AURDEDRAFT_175741 [Auricularia subglabra TFB-10046 SS5]|uniref:Uncharacterized protein n=1 Tax=Auricularia subglabra (strain TFB-10046 / SS5) TaxID=717982 RepID=J0CWX1_AURST|nr:hypothetical protein AURDEDRAFT_175741 [Auricularia subglabra TFB-10046 SS5]